MKIKIIGFLIISVLLFKTEFIFSQNLKTQTWKYKSSDYIYTSRDSDSIDTLFLPIDRPCFIRITTKRYVRDYQKINNSQYKNKLHLIYSTRLLSEDSTDVDNCCWSPSYYQIAPLITYIYTDSVRLRVDDLISLRVNKKKQMQYWESELNTKIGQSIVNYMPFIEMYLWMKISNEITLLCDKKKTLLFDLIDVQILPSGDDNCLTICRH